MGDGETACAAGYQSYSSAAIFNDEEFVRPVSLSCTEPLSCLRHKTASLLAVNNLSLVLAMQGDFLELGFLSVS